MKHPIKIERIIPLDAHRFLMQDCSYYAINRDMKKKILHIDYENGIQDYENARQKDNLIYKIVSFRNKFSKIPFMSETEITCKKDFTKPFSIRIGCTIFNYKAFVYLEKKGFFYDFAKFKRLMCIFRANIENYHNAPRDSSYKILFNATKSIIMAQGTYQSH